MDNNVEEYLGVQVSSEYQILEETSVDLHYERKISLYRSSTTIVERSWANTQIVSEEELHYEEFV